MQHGASHNRTTNFSNLSGVSMSFGQGAFGNYDNSSGSFAGNRDSQVVNKSTISQPHPSPLSRTRRRSEPKVLQGEIDRPFVQAMENLHDEVSRWGDWPSVTLVLLSCLMLGDEERMQDTWQRVGQLTAEDWDQRGRELLHKAFTCVSSNDRTLKAVSSFRAKMELAYKGQNSVWRVNLFETMLRCVEDVKQWDWLTKFLNDVGCEPKCGDTRCPGGWADWFQQVIEHVKQMGLTVSSHVQNLSVGAVVAIGQLFMTSHTNPSIIAQHVRKTFHKHVRVPIKNVTRLNELLSNANNIEQFHAARWLGLPYPLTLADVMTSFREESLRDQTHIDQKETESTDLCEKLDLLEKHLAPTEPSLFVADYVCFCYLNFDGLDLSSEDHRIWVQLEEMLQKKTKPYKRSCTLRVQSYNKQEVQIEISAPEDLLDDVILYFSQYYFKYRANSGDDTTSQDNDSTMSDVSKPQLP